jgi:hypothetical protein
MYKRIKIEKYLISHGYNEELVKELDNNEIKRIFILELMFNSTITLN